MPRDDEGSRSDRTFSIEEVGEIVRLASEGKAAAAADHDRVTYDELKVIAAEVGVDEPALARIVDTRETAPASTELATGEETPARALVPASPTLPSTLGRDAAIAAGVVAAAAGLDLAVGLGGLVLGPALLLAGAALVGRTFFRAIASMVRGQHSPAPLDAEHRYQVTFGDTLIDLTHLHPGDEPETVQVQVTFGEATILLDPEVPYRLESSVLFGEVRRPREKHRKRRGRKRHRDRDRDHDRDRDRDEDTPKELMRRTPRLILRVKVLFGSAKIRLASSAD